MKPSGPSASSPPALTVRPWRIASTGARPQTGGRCGHDLAVAASMPRRNPPDWHPPPTFAARPSWHQGPWANRVAVVECHRRPLSLVLVATCCNQLGADVFDGSQLDSLAMVTAVIDECPGAPNFFSISPRGDRRGPIGDLHRNRQGQFNAAGFPEERGMHPRKLISLAIGGVDRPWGCPIDRQRSGSHGGAGDVSDVCSWGKPDRHTRLDRSCMEGE